MGKMAGKPHLADLQRFHIRSATKIDVPGITEVFLRSFNAPFWQYTWPDKPSSRQWLDQAWSLGLDNPTDRTFVVVDNENDNKVVAFSRWMVPQDDGNQERKWPDLSVDEYDMDVMGPFFGGMEENRVELMRKRPHWFLEMLGTHEDYQRKGIAARLIKWGTDQADKEGLETYLDGSEKGQPYYKRWHNFKFGKDINIPDRPQYGSFHYVSLVRPPQN